MVTFYRWAQSASGISSLASDFISDMQRDEAAAHVKNSYEAWKSHLLLCNACDHAMDAFEELWKDYTAFLGSGN